MRVTDSSRYRIVKLNLNRSRERMTNLQEQLATGKRINRPSDDPENMSSVLRLRTILESNHQYEENIQDGIMQLTAQEEAVNQVYDVLLELKEITIEGASDSITVRESLALQVQLIMDNLLEIANTKFNGKYIFAGTETLTKPFVANQNVINFNLDGPVVDYRGNIGDWNRQINENTKVPVNLNGKEVFDQSASGGISIFQMLFNLKKNLANDETQNIINRIKDVDTAIDQILTGYLKIGTRKQLILFNEDRFMGQNIQIKAAMSNLEDTNYGEAFINFKAEENALNSALSAGARVISPSLLDFMGGI